MNPLIGISAIIGGAWRNFVKNIAFNLEIASWGVMLTTILSALPILFDVLSVDSQVGTYITVAVALPVTIGISVIWLGIIWSTSEQLDGRRNNVLEAIGHGFHRFISFIWLNLLTFFAILLGTILMAIGLAIPTWFAYKFGGNISVIWLILAFLPFIPSIILPFYAYTRYHFSFNFLVVDGLSGSSAMRASQQISTGRFWPVFFRLLVVIVLFTLAARFVNYLVFLLVGSVAGDPRMFFTPIANIEPTANLKIMIVTVLSNAIHLLGLPLLIAADLIIWRDLKRTAK